jgi:trans-aconitate 2-methyltransferase
LSWDAEAYDLVSSVQEAWGRKVVGWKRCWKGYEKVMDAGCGTGKLTRILAQKVPSGMVYAVDIDSNMIQVASKNLNGLTNTVLIKSDLLTVRLHIKVDVIFSNAAIHWILDHRKLFENFWHLLNNGGEMLIQCGGHGNLDGIISILDEIRQHAELRSYFANWKERWYFPKPDDTSKILQDIGFTNIDVGLVRESAKFDDKNSFALFAKTVVMKPYLALLPNQKLKDLFLELTLDEIERNYPNMHWIIDYVRLNIVANKN